MSNKPLPSHIEAERSVLAAILLDSKAYFKARGIIGFQDFYNEAHRIIFYALDQLYATSEDVDTIKLGDFLKQKDKLEEVGGTEYLIALLESIPTTANIETHARIVKEKSILRRVAALGQRLYLEALGDDQEVDKILGTTSNQLFELLIEASGYNTKQDLVSPQQMASRIFDKIHTAMEHPGKLRGIAVGFPEFDIISKGLREFTLLAADTGGGKTVLALNWAVNLGIKKQIPCLYINCEMSGEDLTYRIISILSGVEEDLLTMGKCGSLMKQVESSIAELNLSQLWVTSNMPKTIHNIIALIYQHKIQYGIKVVFVDYLGEIEYDALAHKEHSEYITYGRWAQVIKNTCAKLDIKPIVIHQLNREGKIASSLKLERKSSLFCTLELNKNKETFLRIRKNRGGRCPVNIALDFNKPTLTIREQGYSVPF